MTKTFMEEIKEVFKTDLSLRISQCKKPSEIIAELELFKLMIFDELSHQARKLGTNVFD